MEQASEVARIASEIGFTACGVARAERIDPTHACAFHEWLGEGHHADMHYMANHEDLRLDPRKLLPGAKSIICVALNYYPRHLLSPQQLQFAYYAYGHDYHEVMRRKLRRLASALGLDTDSDAKLCCDTVPMLDRYWAWRAGLGWIGRNKNLILPQAGSFFFLGEIITRLSFDRYAEPMSDRCGSCSRCVDACPTGALHQHPSGSTTLDARRCLSYLTIENRSDIPADTASAMGRCIYGCDRCQLACPHNRFATPSDIDEFCPTAEFLAMQPTDWSTLTPERYRSLFKGSAVKRAKFEGLRRNIDHVLGQNKEKESGPSHDEPDPKI